MNEFIVIRPLNVETESRGRLSDILGYALKGRCGGVIRTKEEFEKTDLRGKRLLFAISIGRSGINTEYYRILRAIRLDNKCLEGCVAGVIVDGSGRLYTKNVSRELVLAANMSGCAFPGRPLVEAVGDLTNFNIIAKVMAVDNMTAYMNSALDLADRVLSFRKNAVEHPKLLAIHAGNSSTSNTLELWHMVKHRMDRIECREISVRDGEVYDCRGCSYETCLHLGESGKCFYGGVITREVYPAIKECDGLVMVCPNYNDAVSANLSAFINRLTALFRVQSFYEKRLFGVIVSGYSGSDIIAQQLISSLCMNKTFMLPPYFALMETANDPHSIVSVPRIQDRVYEFAKRTEREFMADSCKDGSI